MVIPVNAALTAQNFTNRLSDADDTVVILKLGEDQYQVTINGDTEVVSAEVLKKMKFDLKGGDDMLVVDENVDVAISANGGDGNDYMIGGGGGDVFSGGRGDDLLNGRGGKNVLIGGADDDTLIDWKGNSILVGNSGADDFFTGPRGSTMADVTAEDQYRAIDTSTSSPVHSPSTPTTTAPTGPTTTGPTTPTTTAPTRPTTTGPTGPTTTTSTNDSSNLAKLMSGPTGVGFTQTAVGVYTHTDKNSTTVVTQPGGPGTPFYITETTTSGENKGAVLVLKADEYNGKASFGSYNNPNLTASENKVVNDAMKNKSGGFDSNYLAQQLELVMGGDNKQKKKGAHGNTSATSSSSVGSGDGADGGASLDGASGADGSTGSTDNSGLDVDGNTGENSWFLVLAKGMGQIMNTFAKRMIELLNKIKDAGDNPPYALTSEFQATSQQLAYMQNAFMTALNSLGESIKTGVTAGGAAR